MANPILVNIKPDHASGPPFIPTLLTTLIALLRGIFSLQLQRRHLPIIVQVALRMILIVS